MKQSPNEKKKMCVLSAVSHPKQAVHSLGQAVKTWCVLSALCMACPLVALIGSYWGCVTFNVCLTAGGALVPAFLCDFDGGVHNFAFLGAAF